MVIVSKRFLRTVDGEIDAPVENNRISVSGGSDAALYGMPNKPFMSLRIRNDSIRPEQRASSANRHFNIIDEKMIGSIIISKSECCVNLVMENRFHPILSIY